MIHSILTAIAAAVFGPRTLAAWRQEPDPAILDGPDDDDDPLPDDASDDDEAAMAARYAARRRCECQDRDEALAAGLVMAGGLDGSESIRAVQGMILERLRHHAIRRIWGDQLN